MTAVTALPRRRVLADAIPGGLARDIALVVGGFAVVAVLARVAVPLPFTPVPLTLGTFAALLVGSALGPVRGLLAVGSYLVVGMAGAGIFADGRSGWAFASFGYIIGFVLAATLVGALARRGQDRTMARTAGLMVLGNLAIYACGVPWLMAYTGAGFGQALALGVTPFLVGDAVKIAVAAGLLPAAWALVRRVEEG